MSSRRVEGDCWEGRTSDDWTLSDPTLADVDRALERLDARRWTMMTINDPGRMHLVIGGGAGRYVVYVGSEGEEELWNLIATAPREGTVVLTGGGQEGEFPARQVVDLEVARTAARTFFLSGELDAALRWEPQ